jgi:GTP-binding protein
MTALNAPANLVAQTGIRTVGIVAHVDHGKTTLVDSLLRQNGAFRANEELVERVMDSGDLEREKGITILAKETAIQFKGVRVVIVDTPGHADFGGEVERSLLAVDAVLLLVDASEGPLPQTRYVLSKALARSLPVVLVINKIDRADARIKEVIDEVYELFLDLGANEQQINFPIVYTNARAGTATLDLEKPGTDLIPLLDVVLETAPAPMHEPGHPLQVLITNLAANDFVGRIAVGRIRNGIVRKGAKITILREDSAISGTVTSLTLPMGIERVEVPEAGPGEIVGIAGLADVEIGETITDPADPRPLERLHVDPPTLQMTFGVNTSPIAGKEGSFLTSRHLRERLDREILGNVSIRVEPTSSPDIIEVAGRGELQLAVLIETMRREGYELQVSRPEVIVRDIDGKRHEPLERAVIDVPDEHVGTVTQALAPRKGKVTDLRPGDIGRTVVTIEAPARGLIGFRSQLLTATRGTALMHQHHAGWTPWVGELPTRKGGAMISDREGVTTGYALDNLQQRGELFVGPGEKVYEGMVVGENARADDMHVNVVREKQKTNIRTHSADEAIKLVPPRDITLETAIEFIADDELVEVTPTSLRLRKRILKESDRRRASKS